MGMPEGRVYEVSDPYFEEWSNRLAVPPLTVEVESTQGIRRGFRGRVDFPPGRVRTDEGQVYVFPARMLLASGMDRIDRPFLCVVPGPPVQGASADKSICLMDHIGELLSAAGARLLTRAEAKDLAWGKR